MPYSQFTTITKVKEAFNLSTIEGIRFLPEIAPISPSNTLRDYLEETLPIAIATGSEKARSELIITPVLGEVRRILNRKVTLFSGEDFGSSVFSVLMLMANIFAFSKPWKCVNYYFN